MSELFAPAAGRNLAEELEKYADLVLRVGLNLQPDQTLFIGGPHSPVLLECVDFVRLLTRRAYELGARRVHVYWGDEDIAKTTIERASAAALAEYPSALVRWYEEAAEQDAAFAFLLAVNPLLLRDVDPQRVATFRQTQAEAMARFSSLTGSMQVSWCVIGHPSPAWARVVHPDLAPEAALERLWWEILYTARVLTDDPVAAWHQHVARLDARSAYLNRQRFARLHFQAPGTDLTVALPDGHFWMGAAEAKNRLGAAFVPNIPTEEVFTAPHRTGVNGTVRSTMPLNYSGVVVENLSLTFQDGRVIDFSADTGAEVIAGLLDTDEGARYLGEVALVPADSPIAELGTLFYNTLFDENAACHLAIGRAYPINLSGGLELSREEQIARGLNYSATHVDFMIGSRELAVDGITAAGEVVPILREGLWVAPTENA